MPLTVHQFPCLQDNYGFLARDTATGLAACIDTPDAGAILRELDKLGWKLDLILNTHWHPDHAGGNAEIVAATGAKIVGPAEVTRISAIDREVKDGEVVMLGEPRFQVIESGGHTLGHIAYFDAADHIAFVGDTLFALGCGRLFEGTPEQMWGSLQRLAALPDETPGAPVFDRSGEWIAMAGAGGHAMNLGGVTLQSVWPVIGGEDIARFLVASGVVPSARPAAAVMSVCWPVVTLAADVTAEANCRMSPEAAPLMVVLAAAAPAKLPISDM